MNASTPQILLLMASPRVNGRCGALAAKLEQALGQLGAQVTTYPLPTYPVAACNGCGACNVTGDCVIVSDGFGVLSRHMDAADALVIVTPVFFSGPCGLFKAALDRCQVYWSRRYLLKQPMPPRRPAHLVVVGEGGDPFGYEPLVTICTSALNSTGLRVKGNVHDFVGPNYQLDRAWALAQQILDGLAPSDAQ